ncbi:hypothetical protein HPB52_023975 [Rhipicephalus sanguineus]|uniref:Uncharacterized protein n=1 Tax=Rhipicephalus sanguineus TaxID=34632 RepID=A0A9D4T116_RHISA|nr:hypothetical protein HPB52_023975 [Rhipicephalus sanguineus]
MQGAAEQLRSSDPESPQPRASVVDLNASSARPPLRLGMATEMLGAFEATSSHDEPTPAENMDLTGPRQKKQQALERKRGTDSTARTSPTNPHQRCAIKVVRPHQGLPLKSISTPARAEAMVTVCNYEIRAARRCREWFTRTAANCYVILTVQVCKTCHAKGHQTDVCPQPDLSLCRTSGHRYPADGHPHEPKRASCGSAHIIGDRSCQQRLKRARPPEDRKRTDKPKVATESQNHWFFSEDEE